MFFRKKSVLVIGGEGFIGSHVVANIKTHGQYYYEVMDMKSGYDVVEYGIPQKFDTIILLAYDFTDSEEARQRNLQIYTTLHYYMQLYPRTHIIYTSSAAVYADNGQAHRETEVPAPSSVYGRIKLAGEQVVSRFKRHTIFRLSNVYGQGGRGVIDLFESGHREIFGDGEQVRDFISVAIVTLCILQAIKKPKRFRGIFNVSSGDGKTINQIFAWHGKGKPLKRKKKEEIRHSVLDNGKLGEVVE